MEPIYALPSLPSLGRGLLALAKLNAWERANIPQLKTASGRDLYFLLAGNSLLRNKPNTAHVKSHALQLHTRTMRNRIREFHDDGLIVISTSASDGRARTIEPSEKLLRVFENHTLAMRSIFKKHFDYMPK